MYGYIVKHICQRDHLLSRTSLEDFFSSSKFGFFCFQPLPQFSRLRYFKFDWVVAHRCKLCTFYNGNVSETSVIVAKKLNFQIFKLYLHTSILDLWNLIKNMQIYWVYAPFIMFSIYISIRFNLMYWTFFIVEKFCILMGCHSEIDIYIFMINLRKGTMNPFLLLISQNHTIRHIFSYIIWTISLLIHIMTIFSVQSRTYKMRQIFTTCRFKTSSLTYSLVLYFWRNQVMY